MNADDWMGLFSELEVAQMKVACPREILNLLKPQPEHEKWLEEPKELQEKVYEAQKAVAEEFGLKETECRAFLRPSGTEDVCRVYAEAPSVSEEEGTQAKAALALAEKLKKAIEEFVASHAKRN
uniref:Alpha-D-phosphohexomutase C-terminal domain-containing protein n=1 Tax=Chromera velia CCMP2878 TaxID=1169474 RepID=A0A0G4HRD7_9ALVE|eukprot:Cvel_30668.t1-p1 / transcript=Cvel_30668.t1 / gene=Cvel_30668 / organism=Chromera_velia_CCMP2878 / gene_product=hypothetical protein / transcript_product=hypothetical protein / location=Cvel_scaffold4415:946-2055(+) / protein_length=123 / sequence_SO=supercontig / SO=protein_coding / is_pseudo=false